MNLALPHDATNVVIVGAGLAGLTAAYTLAQANVRVVVLEARDRVGGRTLALTAGEGQRSWFDVGATWTWPHQTHVRELSQALGVKRFEQHGEGETVLDLGPQGYERHAVLSPMIGTLRFEQGADELSLRLAAHLPAGSVKLRVHAKEVRVTGAGVLVSAEGPAGEPIEFHAGTVVLALPPRLAAHSLTFTPELPSALAQVLRETRTWMGHAMKAVVVYERAFWREQHLSGFAVSHIGPLQEIHDASPPDVGVGALFGFFGAQHSVRDVTWMQRRELVLRQLGRLFGPTALRVRSYVELDWAREGLTSTAQDGAPPRVHPQYGHPLLQEPALGGRVFWAGAETSAIEGGLVEGAVRSGERAARLVLARPQKGERLC